MLETCSDSCGYIAGIIAAFSFGSFGVPIKLISNNIKVDPLVMQSYKTFVSFLTCWLVIPLLGEKVRFTPWGIVSGLFWVPGATAGIYGIQNAGLAVSVGTWSSLTVISSFSWGIIVFNEKVKSIRGACGAALVLIIGLIGMSIYSAPEKNIKEEKGSYQEESVPFLGSFSKGSSEIASLSECNSQDDFDTEAARVEKGNGGIDMMHAKLKKKGENIELQKNENSLSTRHRQKFRHEDAHKSMPGRIITRRKKLDGIEMTERRIPGGKNKTSQSEEMTTDDKLNAIKEEEFNFCGGAIQLSRRQLGIIGAVLNGIWGGNNMIPLHYASKQGFRGAGYLISYSSGAMLVTIVMWGCRYLNNLYYWEFDRKQAYNALPSFHVREMWFGGFIAGGLYSLGNLCSILAVTSLGQGVGFSFVQTSMLVSGVWGIFYFGEVQGFDRISKWLISSLATIAGILWLSYEHQGAVSH